MLDTDFTAIVFLRHVRQNTTSLRLCAPKA